jgi:hypothetical protein
MTIRKLLILSRKLAVTRRKPQREGSCGMIDHNALRERHNALYERIIVALTDAIEEVKRDHRDGAKLERIKAAFVERLRRAKLN